MPSPANQLDLRQDRATFQAESRLRTLLNVSTVAAQGRLPKTLFRSKRAVAASASSCRRFELDLRVPKRLAIRADWKVLAIIFERIRAV